MDSVRYVDVFSGTPFKGNALAVFHGADGLSDEQMADIARWTNLSETTFLMTPTDPAADYAVRIWTTGGELPFAGHPTLGSAHAWLEAGGVPARELRRQPRRPQGRAEGGDVRKPCVLVDRLLGRQQALLRGVAFVLAHRPDFAPGAPAVVGAAPPTPRRPSAAPAPATSSRATTFPGARESPFTTSVVALSGATCAMAGITAAPRVSNAIAEITRIRKPSVEADMPAWPASLTHGHGTASGRVPRRPRKTTVRRTYPRGPTRTSYRHPRSKAGRAQSPRRPRG